MGVPKSLDYKDFMSKSTSANPTTWDDMYRFFGNQGEITAALVKSLLYQPDTAYSMGAIVYSPNLPAGTIAKCTVAGTTGSTEPVWPAVGSAVNDGTARWIVENIRAPDLTAYMKKDADSDLSMNSHKLVFPTGTISAGYLGGSRPALIIDASNSIGVNIKAPSVLVNGSLIATETDLSKCVKSINNITPDSSGNVNISTSGGGSNLTVDATLDGTSSNAIANKAVYAALNNKLDKNGTAMYASRDSSGNIITDTYAKKSEVSGVVKSVNNITPDSNGNVTITVSGGGGGGSGDYLPLTGGTVTGGITATNFQTGTGAANYFQCRKFRGEGNANSYYHAIDFGYSGHDSVDFYEYDPNWNFYKCLTGTKAGAVLVGNINGNGWNGGARLTGEPTAPTAAAGTNTTQIATTAFVQTAVGGKANTSDLADFVTTSGQNTWRAQQTFNLATLGYEQYSAPYSSTNSVSPSTSAASYYATGAFTLNLATLSALLGSNQSTVFSAYITASGDYALSITNGGTVKYIGEASDVAITSAGLLLNILMTKDSYGSLTSIVQTNKLT